MVVAVAVAVRVVRVTRLLVAVFAALATRPTVPMVVIFRFGVAMLVPAAVLIVPVCMAVLASSVLLDVAMLVDGFAALCRQGLLQGCYHLWLRDLHGLLVDLEREAGLAQQRDDTFHRRAALFLALELVDHDSSIFLLWWQGLLDPSNDAARGFLLALHILFVGVDRATEGASKHVVSLRLALNNGVWCLLG